MLLNMVKINGVIGISPMHIMNVRPSAETQ